MYVNYPALWNTKPVTQVSSGRNIFHLCSEEVWEDYRPKHWPDICTGYLISPDNVWRVPQTGLLPLCIKFIIHFTLTYHATWSKPLTALLTQTDTHVALRVLLCGETAQSRIQLWQHTLKNKLITIFFPDMYRRNIKGLHFKCSHPCALRRSFPLKRFCLFPLSMYLAQWADLFTTAALCYFCDECFLYYTRHT